MQHRLLKLYFINYSASLIYYIAFGECAINIPVYSDASVSIYNKVFTGRMTIDKIEAILQFTLGK